MTETPSPKELERQGWTRRFTIEEHRATECVENYEALGFEVVLLPARLTQSDQACTECFRAETCKLVTIYTRPKDRKQSKSQ